MPQQNAVEPTNYDAVPYASYPYSNTNPERLYTIARLFGMQPEDFKNCKVLELGCASGGNLIPMATMFPDSTFIGVDLSETQVKQGQEQIKALGLKNITLKAMSVTDITTKFGKFDYIIAHGVLSWVAENVQAKIFEIFNQNLTKNGIAYVSYNTLPGWNAVKSIREMMLFHTRDFIKPEDKVRQARLLLKFISEANAGAKTPYAQAIDEEIAILSEYEDIQLFHDHLEENNTPFYLYQVVQKATENGLQYLGDTAIASMYIGNFADKTAEILSQAGNDVVKTEQYMDFIRSRRFRTTLFCHKEVVLNRNLKPESLEGFYVTMQASTTANLNNVDLTTRNEISIPFENGATLTTKNPAVILAISLLYAQKGKPIATEDLLNKLFNAVGASANKEALRAVVLEQLMRLMLAGIVGINSFPGQFITEVTARPKVSDLARYQATTNPWITNQRSEKNVIDVFNRVLIQYLDGNNDFESILGHMQKHVENDDLSLNIDGKKVSDKEQIRNVLKEVTKQNIENLVPCALLVA